MAGKREVRAALTGACGRMGSLIIRRILETDGITLSAAFDISNIGKDVGEVIGAGRLDISVSDSKNMSRIIKETKTDVVIDFTIAAATALNAPVAAGAGADLIIGTTGLTAEQRTDITDAVIKNNVAAVISSNYSVGVNVFFKLVKEAAKYMGDYDIEIIEAHHNQKKDAPSGTAMTAAEIINETLRGKDIAHGREGLCPRGKEIGMHAIRGGDIVGDHTVMFIGNSERIELRHQAHTREIFVGGAVTAAKWVTSQKKGIVYSMPDVLNI
jgi:4-hydroxy-tetrahydrodipicolinate reductase